MCAGDLRKHAALDDYSLFRSSQADRSVGRLAAIILCRDGGGVFDSPSERVPAGSCRLKLKYHAAEAGGLLGHRSDLLFRLKLNTTRLKPVISSVIVPTCCLG